MRQRIVGEILNQLLVVASLQGAGMQSRLFFPTTSAAVPSNFLSPTFKIVKNHKIELHKETLKLQ